MLSKVRRFVDKKFLKSIYHAIFESHFLYSCLVGQRILFHSRLYTLQKKSLRLIHFVNRTTLVFNYLNILSFSDKIGYVLSGFFN